MKAKGWVAEGYGPGPYYPITCATVDGAVSADAERDDRYGFAGDTVTGTPSLNEYKTPRGSSLRTENLPETTIGFMS